MKNSPKAAKQPTTMDDILNELRRAAAASNDADAGGMTSYEIAAKLGINAENARKMIKRAIASGKMVCRRCPRLNITGSMSKSPLYFPRSE